MFKFESSSPVHWSSSPDDNISFVPQKCTNADTVLGFMHFTHDSALFGDVGGFLQLK